MILREQEKSICKIMIRISAYQNQKFNYPIYIISNKQDLVSCIEENIKDFSTTVIFVDSFIKDLDSTSLILKIFSNVLNSLNKRILVYHLEPGKQSKNLNTIEFIANWLLKNNVQRDSLFISIGGGVIGDLIGFLSSIYFRGVSLAHIPTNLISMTDSAIGGKTAVNTTGHVNTLGTYKHPNFTLIYLDFLSSLPQRDFVAGFAEIIKISIIKNHGLFELIQNLSRKKFFSQSELKEIESILAISIKYKLDFTEGDIEENNKRLFLNIGHTFGHAIESIQDLNTEEYYRHGEAVSLGLISCIYLSDKIFKTHNLTLIKELLLKFNLPTKIPEEYIHKLGLSKEVLLEKLVETTMNDKKGKGGKLTLILLNDFYNPVLFKTDDKSIIKEGFEEIF